MYIVIVFGKVLYLTKKKLKKGDILAEKNIQ